MRPSPSRDIPTKLSLERYEPHKLMRRSREQCCLAFYSAQMLVFLCLVEIWFKAYLDQPAVTYFRACRPLPPPRRPRGIKYVAPRCRSALLEATTPLPRISADSRSNAQHTIVHPTQVGQSHRACFGKGCLRRLTNSRSEMYFIQAMSTEHCTLCICLVGPRNLPTVRYTKRCGKYSLNVRCGS